MPAPLFLGLDLGTTNAKAAIYDGPGKLIGAQTVAYPTAYSEPGGAEQRLADWTTALTQACHQLMNTMGNRARDLVAMGLSAHGPGVVLLDERGQPLLPTSPIWQDTRCTLQGEALLTTLGRAWTGLHLARNSFPAQLKWTRERYPAQAAQARYALGIKDYLVYWLTGALVTEPSQVAGGLVWWPELMTASGWGVEQLPPVQPATAVVGQMRATLVEALGLPAPLPVVSGLADGAAATLSMGAIHPNQAVLTLATSGVIRVVSEQAVDPLLQHSHNLFCWPYLEGRWITGGHIKAAGTALQWLQGLLTPTEASLEHLLAQAAASPVGSQGVIFLPYLLGRGSPQADETAQGAFLGLTLGHGASDLTRAVLEGVAFAYRDVLDDFVVMGHEIRELHISGGGAASGLWRQILADVLQRPLVYYSADSTLGAAMVAAIGVGHYADCGAAIAAMVSPGLRIEPDGATVSQAEAALQTYRAWRDRLYGKEGNR